MFCQRCGKRNDLEREKCKYCSAPLLMVAPDRSSDASSVQPFMGVEEYLIDKVAAMEKQSGRFSEEVDLLVHAMDFLERNAMVDRAGIHVLVEMLQERGLIEPKEFGRRWRERTLRNLQDLYHKERLLDAKPEILAAFQGKSRRRFEELVAKAEDLLYSLDSKAASQALDHALLIAPDNVPLLGCLGIIHLGLGRLDKAERCLSRAVQAKAPPPGAQLAYARLLLHLGRPTEADKILSQAAQKHPEDTEALMLLALAKAMAGDWLRCQHHADKALGLEEHPACSYLLAHALLRRGRTTAAEKRLDELIAAYPEWEEALHQRALLHLARGWWSRAEEALDRLRRLDPEVDSAKLVRQFKRTERPKRAALAVLPLDVKRMLERMDPVAEEAGMYLRQLESEG